MDPQTLIVSTMQIFAILNPLSVVPTFLSLTEGRNDEEVRRIVKVVSVAIFLMMLLFSALGKVILMILGVTVTGLKIGGGIILTVLAIDMLQGMPRTKEVEEEELAVVPLATPLLMGPGTMTTILVLSTEYTSRYGFLAANSILFASSAVVTAATYLILMHSSRLRSILGVNGLRGLARFMAIIVAAAAADMLTSGVADWISGLGH